MGGRLSFEALPMLLLGCPTFYLSMKNKKSGKMLIPAEMGHPSKQLVLVFDAAPGR
jgi:hypothetical protein